MATSPAITQVYWKTLDELLHPDGPRRQELVGFDDEFVDIVDYIIRITHRIWEQKDIGLCYDYYAKYCPVHTLGGYCDDVDVVVQNTLKTIAAFPDRSLIGENVVWSKEQDGSYYSSHRITSVMTNKGASEFGPATGTTGRVTTIADCVCKENRIVYEWLMRDNSFLVKQLGISPLDAARHQSQGVVPNEFSEWINQEYQRVSDKQVFADDIATGVDADVFQFMSDWLDTLLNRKNLNQLAQFYHLNAKVQWPGGRRAVGMPGISGIFTQWLAQCPDAHAVLDHIAVVPFDDDTIDVAIRWSLAGKLNPRDTELMEFAGLPQFILAGSHMRIKNNKIIQEWTVFDEVASIANLIRQLPNGSGR